MIVLRPSALSFFVLAALALVPGCACGTSHGRDDAGHGGDGGCLGTGPMYCALSCGSDAGTSPVCVDGRWQCPPGTVDPASCPPTCWGPPPGPDCFCDTTASPVGYVCGSECPAGLNPWDPSDPANRCSPEGRRCSSGSGSVCGSAMSCECAGGAWSCAVAEPDPACWCGREPEPGSPCSEEGMSCGACCPTPGVPAFGPYTCREGTWMPLDCPAIECPPAEPPCPAVRPVGGSCGNPGQVCGDACCGSATTCGPDGRWLAGPEADCLCDPSRAFACGPGSCTGDRACSAHCGPDDGIEHACIALPPGCTSCECAPLRPGLECEAIDGHVFLREAGFCG